ncbi:MAG: 2-C-methyl-D-erythritol 4-phosphate cytidylyltransferase [Gammaproteobacteria bacterium]|nr:2-C-methyl-D-erythritol 4-phosphate cytidylyltransferase [Gammaproteobacteria bacterium]
MAADRPKQYLSLAGRTVIEHSLDRLLSHPAIVGAVVAVSPDDGYWADLSYPHKKRHDKTLWVAEGGRERCDSVLNALRCLHDHAADDDWVLVHDAARPCVRREDIDALIQQASAHPCGGILAVAAHDTIKQAGPGREIRSTVDRSTLWHAQTPQMFRLAALANTLEQALAAGVTVTDEASAMEWAGHSPLLVAGHTDNIKITRPEDLALAEFYLANPESSSSREAV